MVAKLDADEKNEVTCRPLSSNSCCPPCWLGVTNRSNGCAVTMPATCPFSSNTGEPSQARCPLVTNTIGSGDLKIAETYALVTYGVWFASSSRPREDTCCPT